MCFDVSVIGLNMDGDHVSQSSSLSAASAGGIGWNWGHILDSADLDAITSDGS